MSDDVEMKVVQVSSIFSETPEGQYHWDRLQQHIEEQERELDRLLTPEARERLRQAEREAAAKFTGL